MLPRAVLQRMSPRPARLCKRTGPQPGFTLIEILIVISIIALLSSLVLVAINKARSGTNEAIAKQLVSTLNSSLELYVQDESKYPGMELKSDPERNDFPELFNALFGERAPNGPGGRTAPYAKYEENKVAVYDADTEEYRLATRDEIHDPKKKKYYKDPWGNPYIYRANKGKKYEEWMHNQYGADIYSMGANQEDDTTNPDSKRNDDIGNW